MLLTILTVAFLLLYALLISFYYLQWKRLESYQPKRSSADLFVTVIVAARNEENSLPLLIHDLCQQDHPSHLWELIIVNDYSTDGTQVLADALSLNMRMIYPHVPPGQSSKKKAIESGIKEAKAELIIITDADCRVGTKWVSNMANFHQEKNASFIAAPVKFSHDNSLLQIFQSLDFMTLQGITAASVSANVHTMCNGANLAYTKSAFNSVNGFEGIDKVATGDDMLLMHKIWKQQPAHIFYLKSGEAMVTTEPMKTWKDFFMQRKRWASKTLVYDDWRIIAVLAFILMFNALFFVLLIIACIHKIYWINVASFLVAKTIIEWPFVSSVTLFYNEQKLMRYFFFIQPLHIFYTVFVGLFSQFGKYEWKGRTVK